MIGRLLEVLDGTPCLKSAWRRRSVIRMALMAPRDWLYCRLHGVPWRWGWVLDGLPLLRRHWTATITIGERYCARSRSRFNSIGVSQPVILTAWGRNSSIAIGDDVGMSGCSITAMSSVAIGTGVLVGSGAIITDSDLHPLTAQGRMHGGSVPTAATRIEDHVFVGARAIVLKGVVIGRAAVIGAGAVVTKSVPANAIVAGNPARLVGYVEEDLHAPAESQAIESQLRPF